MVMTRETEAFDFLAHKAELAGLIASFDWSTNLYRRSGDVVSKCADDGYRVLLKRFGPDQLAGRISSTRHPISRPDAALKDPFMPQLRPRKWTSSSTPR